MAAFATTADMLVYHDARTLGDLVTDDGTRITQANLLTDANLLALLDAATGEMIAAVQRAKRYTRAQLDGLTGESLQFRKSICCAITFWLIWKRKAYNAVEDGSDVAAREKYDRIMEMLDSGERVFDVDDVQDAGGPDITTITHTELVGDWEMIVDIARHSGPFPQRRTFRSR